MAAINSQKHRRNLELVFSKFIECFMFRRAFYDENLHSELYLVERKFFPKWVVSIFAFL